MSAIEANDELRAAIKRGDLEAVDRALQSGISPDSEVTDLWGGTRSLLHLAAEVYLCLQRKFTSFFLLLICFCVKVRPKRCGGSVD